MAEGRREQPGPRQASRPLPAYDWNSSRTTNAGSEKVTLTVLSVLYVPKLEAYLCENQHEFWPAGHTLVERVVATMTRPEAMEIGMLYER